MSADPMDHTEANDGTFIQQVIGQTAELKKGFLEQGHDPYDLPPNFIISVYPGVWIRVVDLLARAREEGFSTRPT